jgi:uncharacterized protein with HEPN domain
MKNPDNGLYLRDILQAAQVIESYVDGCTYDSFVNDQMRRDAILMQLSVIGEAAGKLSVEFRMQHPEVPWKLILGMRHRIAHDYRGLRLNVVWDTVKVDIPLLRIQLQDLLSL